ncbi:MAG TPA: lmo0937 family membrane protein [Acidobacteriaceae bacterium]|nr:lmo0937 family membrane protein [Acidobacteriaceae bacterium]
MFLILAIVLVVLWLGGFFLMHISSLFIHLLIIFAVISLVIHLISGRRA